MPGSTPCLTITASFDVNRKSKRPRWDVRRPGSVSSVMTNSGENHVHEAVRLRRDAYRSQRPGLGRLCAEITRLDAKFKEAEAQSGQAPLTPHQAGTLQAPKGQTGGAATMPSTGSAPDTASSEHQREVLKGAGQQSDQEKFAAQLQEARQLAQNGNEVGCRPRSVEVRKLLGTQ